MARYRKVDVRMWGDAFFRGLSPIPPCGAGLWFYLLTGEETGIIPGLFRAGEAGMAEALGWPVEGFREAFREVSREGKALADWKARLVWVPNAGKHNKPESPNVVRSWRGAWDELPECPLKYEAWRQLRAFCEGLGEGFAKAFREACPEPSPKTMANQEQEQEVAAARGRALARDDQPVVQDGGEAAPAGIAGETRGAAGPGHLRAVASEPDAPRSRPWTFEDRTELGLLGAEYRGRLERELGHGLAVAAAERAGDVRAELEQLLERPEHGGVERALSWTLATLAARRRSGADEPGSIAYLLPILREMPPREPGALERIRVGCPEWAAVLDAVVALPPERSIGDAVERWLLPLDAVFRRGELHLEAPSEGHRTFVAEYYLGGLRKIATETIGPHVLVHLTAAAEPAAREA